jgi:hypothetical protein
VSKRSHSHQPRSPGTVSGAFSIEKKSAFLVSQHPEPHAKKLYQQQQCNCVVPKSDDGYSREQTPISSVVPKSDDGFDTKEVRDQDKA